MYFHIQDDFTVYGWSRDEKLTDILPNIKTLTPLSRGFEKEF